jgi:HK97 gp10 family phage protein
MIKFDSSKFINQALKEIGDVLVDDAKENMNKISFGRTYVIGGRIHIASKAGESPNNLSGKLKDSIRYEIQKDVLEFGAGNERINYAKYLEKGTEHISQRPNYTKVILKNRKNIERKLEDAIIKSLKVVD